MSMIAVLLYTVKAFHIFFINVFMDYHINHKEAYGLPCIFRYFIKKCNIVRTSVRPLVVFDIWFLRILISAQQSCKLAKLRHSTSAVPAKPLTCGNRWNINLYAYKIMYVLAWRNTYALTRGLFWCLFPELRSNDGNKHQNSTRVTLFFNWQVYFID